MMPTGLVLNCNQHVEIQLLTKTLWDSIKSQINFLKTEVALKRNSPYLVAVADVSPNDLLSALQTNGTNDND